MMNRLQMSSFPAVAVIGLVGRSMFFCVPRFHSGGETVHATEFYEEWGGKGFNQAVASGTRGAEEARVSLDAERV